MCLFVMAAINHANPPLCQVFSGNTFYAMGELSSTVPVLSVGGLAKEFLVPGWRVGWVMVHDKNGVFEEVRQCVSPLLLVLSSDNHLCVPPGPQGFVQVGDTDSGCLHHHSSLHPHHSGAS